MTAKTVSLEQVRDAMDPGTGGGMDADAARSLADQYVGAHPELFAELATKSIDECVRAVDVFRSAGMLDEQWRVEVWLLHHFEPQNIGGVSDAKVRII